MDFTADLSVFIECEDLPRVLSKKFQTPPIGRGRALEINLMESQGFIGFFVDFARREKCSAYPTFSSTGIKDFLPFDLSATSGTQLLLSASLGFKLLLISVSTNLKPV